MGGVRFSTLVEEVSNVSTLVEEIVNGYQQHAHRAGAKPELESADDLSSLSTAVNVALWAWYYKTCHKNSVVYAWEHRDDVSDALSDDSAVFDSEKARGGEL